MRKQDKIVALGYITVALGRKIKLPRVSYFISMDKRDKICPFNATCVEFEMDGYGSSLEEAYENLVKLIKFHIASAREITKTAQELAQFLVSTIFEVSKQKDRLESIFEKAYQACVLIQTKKLSNDKLKTTIDSFLDYRSDDKIPFFAVAGAT